MNGWDELIANLAREGKTLDYWKEYQNGSTDSSTTDAGDQRESCGDEPEGSA